MFHKKALWHGLTYVFTPLLAVSVLLSSVLEANKATVDGALGTQSSKIESTDGEGLYTRFKPKDDYIKTVQTAEGETKTYLNTHNFLRDEIQMGRRAAYEGAVLLKNRNNALPLNNAGGQVGVTLLGKRSHIPCLGSGQGVNAVGQIITLERALGGTATNFAEDRVSGDYSTLDNYEFSELNLPGRSDGAGANFRLNQNMIDKYAAMTIDNNYKITYNDKPVNYCNKNGRTGNVAREVPVSEISSVSLDGYTDAGIIVFGRPSSESADFIKPKGDEKGPLALTDEELALVDYSTANFKKTIVIINTNSPMEIRELEENPKVDAILWVGHPGNFGCLGIADVLCGRVAPSGGLADIYVTDNMSAPAMMNFGDYAFTNAAEVRNDGGRGSSSKYVVEAEGIYTGYRYYETRYNDIVLNQGNAKSNVGAKASDGNWDYSKEVVYSFGYGFGYTDFKYEIVGTHKEQESHEKYTTIDVKVTNTGDYAGATPVQIYAQAPYKAGGLEKSAIQLVEFGKTKVLEPKQSEVVSIEVDWQNLASYDMNYGNSDGTKGSYVLDEGNYYFAVGNGAHDALNNILAKQGFSTADGMDVNGNADLAVLERYSEGGVDASTFGYAKNNQKIRNQIPYSDWNYYEPGKVTYLSRSNWSGTYPKEYRDMAIPEAMKNDIKGLYYTTKTDQDTSDIVWGDASVPLNFYDLAMMSYEDERWEQVLNKITLEDAITMAAYGGNTFAAAQSIGFPGGKLTENTGNGIQNYTPDAPLVNDLCPWKMEPNDGNGKMSLKVFGSAVLVASSFSHELFYDMGEFMGQQAIIIGLPILWGPGGNTHRTAYNGRTGEYYSEDPVLTGIACMEFAVGARDNGLIASPKHYAFNDQEDNRGGIAPFLTEQRAREIELRAFQIAFEATPYDRKRGEDTGMLGMMVSFSKVGAVECTCSAGLINGIAIGEWGFHGYCVTDISDDFDLFDCIVMAGCTGYDNRMIGDPSWEKLTASNTSINNRGVAVTIEHYAGDRDLQLALKDSVHRTLYTFCQSVLMNQTNSSTKVIELVTWWRVAYVALIAVSATLTLGSAAMFVLSTIKTKEED